MFHVDPQRGSAQGDGSLTRPWRDLNEAVAAGFIGESHRRLWLADRVAARLSGRAPPGRIMERNRVRVRAGDTVMLASGDYGDVDLSGLANSGFVTIAAAPQARPRFAALKLSSASHFVLRGIIVTPASAPAGRQHLVTLHTPGALRADNIVLDGLEIASSLALARTPPEAFADRAPDGIILAGDCVALTDSRVHDVGSAVSVHRGREVLVAGNTIADIAVDGIQFSRHDVAIRDNVISDQWSTPSSLHPDCMQGVGSDDEPFGRLTITGNVCIRALAATQTLRAARADSFGWQGIAIFDGRWRGVTILCNLVVAAAQHGIALYGAQDALIEGNVVLAMPGGRPSWIAALPAKNGRQSAGVTIRGNRATAFLNAVKDSPLPVEAMIDVLRVRRQDGDLVTTLRGELSGVTLAEGNVWQSTEAPPSALARDKRFVWNTGLPSPAPRDVAEARRLHPLPTACGELT